MKTVNPSGRSHQKSSPQHQEVLAVDALCHMGAALGVLELHAERAGSAMVCAARDLLRGYHASADLAVASLQAGDPDRLEREVRAHVRGTVDSITQAMRRHRPPQGKSRAKA